MTTMSPPEMPAVRAWARLLVALAAGVGCAGLAGVASSAAAGDGGAWQSASAVPPVFGARAAGLAGAYTALTGDLFAIYHNPAGLAEPWFEVSFSTAARDDGPGIDPRSQMRQLREVFADPVSISRPVRGYTSTAAGVAIHGSALGLLAEGEVDVRESPDEAGGLSGGGRFVSSAVFAGGHQLSAGDGDVVVRVGSAVRLVYVQAFEVGSACAGSSGQDTGGCVSQRVGRGFSGDLGVQVDVWRLLRLGLLARDVAGTISWAEPGGTTLRSEQWVFRRDGIRLGAALVPEGYPGLIAAEWWSDGHWAVGAEQRIFLDALAIRVGHRRGPAENASTAGLGVKLGPLGLDAALIVPAGEEAVRLAAGLDLRF